ncbi:MAG: hypothetical protein QF781_05000 [Phycisphaerales bacterium]|jgi:hypothetical protein|nr:hypothetical protein [Planctomycetaceae bacterium]MDP6311500.1 hypothetical protein [Phycisphaerales bacterium]MDP7087711.1 hypothetical protein [Phycisphaerales bacterium]|tara:strand:- start:239 stop:1783 length:1545 start_codon:yes stop_codon:yes gene_type:complete
MRWPLAATAAAILSTAASADYRDWCGWTELVDRIGLENVPTGADVIVGQVEAPNSSGHYMPDGDEPDFDGKYLIRRSGGSTTPSGHATMVAKKYYGLTNSLAPGVWFINCYEVNNWLQGGYLHVGSGGGTPPDGPMGDQKIWNHSWVGSFGSTNNDHDALRRVDWVVGRDDVLVTVGLNNGTIQQPLLSYGYNSISVGRRDGDHSWGDVPAPYEGAGRMKPDITGPLFTTSEATPTIAAAGAMFVEMVRNDPALPDEGEASETLKAVLMASATHSGPSGSGLDWNNNAPESGPDRGSTARPLDELVGAGHLDVNRAHMIFAGGQTDGSPEVGAAPLATQHGWSFDTFASSEQRNLRFTMPEGAAEFSALATWNRDVADNFSSFTLADINLELFRLESGTPVSLIGNETAWLAGNVASLSTVDNVEHLYLLELEPGDYILQLRCASGAADVALAWYSSDIVDGVFGDINGDGLVGVDDLLQLLAAWGECSGCPEDLDGDGFVGVNDLLAMLGAWS